MSDGNVLHNFTLPESTVNSQGLRYDPRSDIWAVSSSGATKLNLSRYRKDCTTLFFHSLKLALVALNRRLQPTSIQTQLVVGLNPLMERLSKPIREIRQADLETYWFALPPERRHWAGSLKSLCSALAVHGIPGHSITPDGLAWLNNIKCGGAERGNAARTWDPVHGPLTPDELDALIRTLHAAFARAEVSTEDYILILLFAAFGARNANLADLKVSDLRVTEKNGATKYELDIPRVKQQGGRFRQSFYTRTLVPELGVLLEGYVSLQTNQYQNLNCGDQLPMFVDQGNTDLIRKCHRSSKQIQVHAVRLAERLAVMTTRTGQPMHVNARRYRYTVGTLARAMGLNPSAIAALLDHGNTRTQEIYAAVSPEVLADITQRLGGFRDPLAAAFLGRVADQGETMGIQRLVFRVRFRQDNPDPSVGGCEASRKCGGRTPYVCYVCPMFTASMEGDHEGALTDVLEERVRFDQDAGDSLRFLAADSVAQAIRKVIALVQLRLMEMGKTLQQIREEKEVLLRERGIIP